MKPSHHEWLKRLPVLFEIPAPDPQRLLRRIDIMERDIMLPVKAVFIGMILYSFHSTEWTGLALSMSDLMVETVQFVFWFYILANVIFAAALVSRGTIAAGGGAMDGGHEQPGGRTVYRGAGVVVRRIGQRFVLAVCRADHPQCGERAAGLFATVSERRHQPLLRAGRRAGHFRGEQ